MKVAKSFSRTASKADASSKQVEQEAAGTAKADTITGQQAEITNYLRVVLFICVRIQTLQNHLQYRCVQFMHAHFQYQKHNQFV